MILARVIVGLVAAAICIAGIGWYAVYLFAPDPRKTASDASSDASPPITVHPAYARRQNKRSVVLGSGAVIAGLALTPEALSSIRTAIPIHTLHGPAMNGWIFLGAILLVVVMGAWIATSGLLRMRDLPDDQ